MQNMLYCVHYLHVTMLYENKDLSRCFILFGVKNSGYTKTLFTFYDQAWIL